MHPFLPPFLYGVILISCLMVRARSPVSICFYLHHEGSRDTQNRFSVSGNYPKPYIKPESLKYPRNKVSVCNMKTDCHPNRSQIILITTHRCARCQPKITWTRNQMQCWITWGQLGWVYLTLNSMGSMNDPNRKSTVPASAGEVRNVKFP